MVSILWYTIRILFAGMSMNALEFAKHFQPGTEVTDLAPPLFGPFLENQKILAQKETGP